MRAVSCHQCRRRTDPPHWPARASSQRGLILTRTGRQNQLAYWREAGAAGRRAGARCRAAQCGMARRNAPMGGLALDAAARAYIDINCAHCHSRTGPCPHIRTVSGARRSVGASFGLCKPPIAAGRGTGNRLYSIVPGDSDASIFVFRMVTNRPDAHDAGDRTLGIPCRRRGTDRAMDYAMGWGGRMLTCLPWEGR